jgi:hypothetical protein
VPAAFKKVVNDLRSEGAVWRESGEVR